TFPQGTRMYLLGYRCTSDNGLSFELLVNGEPLGTLIGSRDTMFPYWIVEDGLPHWPANLKQDLAIHIVAVCECGDYGCGCVVCRVDREGDEVIFHEFSSDVWDEGKQFRFSAKNYEAVCTEIEARAKGHTWR